MVIKCKNLYNPADYGSVSILSIRFFLLSVAMTLTLKNSHHGDLEYKVVWSCGLQFNLYSAHKFFFLLSDTAT
jgi:hypothetical protein